MRLLFITATRIGDAVLSSGALAHLLESYPGLQVTLAAGPPAAPLFAAVPGVVRVITVTKQPYGAHWLTLCQGVARPAWIGSFLR